MGPDRRAAAAGCRNAHGHPAQEGAHPADQVARRDLRFSGEPDPDERAPSRGALMRVASFASLSGKELTNDVVEHLLKDILQEEARHSVTIEQIQRRVAEHFDVRLAGMTSKPPPANIAVPRPIAMYLARELTKASLNEIGDAFGGRDHGTVLHACKLVKRRMQEQDNIRQTISFIDSALQR